MAERHLESDECGKPIKHPLVAEFCGEFQEEPYSLRSTLQWSACDGLRGNECEREGQPMPRVDFDQLPDDARLWIFAAERSLSEAEQAQLLTEVDRFIGQWGAHEVPLTAGRDLRYDRFLFVAVDRRKAGPSGCSIDALFRQTKALEQELGIELVNHAPVVFRQGSAIERVPRDQFAELAAAGTVGFETTVFDNTLTCVGDIRAGRWETRLANSWHARAFF